MTTGRAGWRENPPPDTPAGGESPDRTPPLAENPPTGHASWTQNARPDTPAGRQTADRTRGTAVLDVEGLDVRAGGTQLLHDVTFSIARGERVGLIGESGSGKSLTALAVMGLLSEGLSATGQARLAGHDVNLVTAGEARMSRIRGNDMAMVFQEPMTALNPTMRVGRQVAEVITLHDKATRDGARKRAVELLDQVGLPDPAAAARAYPHQLSGGQRQRVVTAIALANDPLLLVCDEPTTALDVTVQARVLDLIVTGVEERDAALLFITHDLAVVANVCERVLVMYGGRIVEAGPVEQIISAPQHRYTQGLLAASDLDRPREAGGARQPLGTIRGNVPPAGAFPPGCVFADRCDFADEQCRTRPDWTVRGEHPAGPTAYGYACWHPAGDDDE